MAALSRRIEAATNPDLARGWLGADPGKAGHGASGLVGAPSATHLRYRVLHRT